MAIHVLHVCDLWFGRAVRDNYTQKTADQYYPDFGLRWAS